MTSNVTMGTLTVSNLNGQFLRAVSQSHAPGIGAAGCAATMTYTFAKLTSNSAQLALPYGAWQLFSGNSSSQTTPVLFTNLTTPAPSTVGLLTGRLTLDPRVVVVP